MPKQEQYTLEEAKKRAQELGSPWTPTLEAQLRKAGKIVDPVAKPVGLPWWQELGAGLGSMIAGPTSGGGGQLDAASRIATGTTMGEQMTAGAAGGLTAGQVSPEMLGIPDPASIVQRGSSLFGQGAGMTAAFTPIGKGAGAVSGGIANPILRAAATGALSFGVYNAAAPAENLGERAKNVLEGGVTGGILGPLPMLPGVRRLAALPGGRTATDIAAFTGLGVAHGQDPLTALAEGAVQLPAMRLVHGAAEGQRRPGMAIADKKAAELESLRRAANSEAAGAPQANDLAAARPSPLPEIAPATEAPAAPAGPSAEMTINRQDSPLSRTPAQMEIPLDAPAVRETRGQRRARLRAEASAVNAGAARSMGTDLTLGSGPLQAGAEAIASAKGRIRWNSDKWARATENLTGPLPEHPTADIVRGYVKGTKDWKTTVGELAAGEQVVKGLDSLPRTDTPEGRAQAIEMLTQDIAKTPDGQALVDMISGGGIREREASGGMTSPPQIIASHTGTVGDPYTMNVIGGARMFDRAVHARIAEYVELRNDLVDRTGVKSSGDREIAGRLMNIYDPAMSKAEFLNRPEVGDLLTKAKVGPAKMFEFVESSRAMMDESRADLNAVASTYGTTEMGYLEEGYFPKHVKGTRNPIEIVRRARAGQQHSGTNRTKPREVYNPARQRRTGDDPETIEVGGRKLPRNWDALEVMDNYMLKNFRTTLGEVALANDMKIAKLLELNGYENAAKDLANVARQRWTSQQWGTGGDIDAAASKTGGGRVIAEWLARNKRWFDRTKYTGNPVFPVATQWTSIIPTALANPRAAAIVAARGDMINQAARDWAKATYTATKKRTSGKPVDAVQGGNMMQRYRSGAVDAVEKAGGALVKAVEEFSMDYAALVARESKTAKGLERRFGERARDMYADTDAGTTQGMFNRADREEVLNSRVVQGLVPAQGYGLSQIRRAAEDVGRIGVDPAEVGIGKTEARARATARMSGVIFSGITSAVLRQMIWQTFMTGKEADPEEIDWGQVTLDAATGAVPFMSILAGTGPSDGATLPAGQAQWIGRGLASAGADAVKGEFDEGSIAKIAAPILSNYGGMGGVPASYIVRKWAQDSQEPETPNTVRSRPAAPRSSRGRQAVPRR